MNGSTRPQVRKIGGKSRALPTRFVRFLVIQTGSSRCRKRFAGFWRSRIVAEWLWIGWCSGRNLQQKRQPVATRHQRMTKIGTSGLQDPRRRGRLNRKVHYSPVGLVNVCERPSLLRRTLLSRAHEQEIMSLLKIFIMSFLMNCVSFT